MHCHDWNTAVQPCWYYIKILKIVQREVVSSENFLEENGNTKNTSYVVNTSKVKKNLMVFSTVEPVLGVNKDDNKKKQP